MMKYFSGIPGTVDFREMLPDIEVAHDDVAEYVGQGIIDIAISHYKSDNYELLNAGEVDEESGSGSGSDLLYSDYDELVYRLQAVITLRSYRDYALNRDATHSSTGRVSRNDKDRDTINLKLIEVDDAALQKKAQRALDRLIKFINQKKFKEWVESDVYSKTRDLLLWNTELFDEFYPIDKNPRVYLMLVPMIRKAQYDLLLSRVGADFFDEFLKKVKAGKLSDKSDILLFSLMGWPVAEMAMAEAIVKLPPLNQYPLLLHHNPHPPNLSYPYLYC